MHKIYSHDPAPLDPEGKIRKLIAHNLNISYDDFQIKVNIGCGTDYLEGWINIDGDPAISCEIHMDLDCENVTIPLESDSVDFIYASHVLEHIWYLPQLKQELIRIAKPGAFIVVVVPYYLSDDAWGDNTHCRGFSKSSFSTTFWKGCKASHLQELNITKRGYEQPFTWLLAALQKQGTYEKIKEGKTTEHCLDCGWCCAKSNFPIPTNDYFKLERMLELFYKQGHPLYWEPKDGEWYVLLDIPCQHYDILTKKCDLYGTGRRPEICGDFICGFPGRMYQRYNNLLKGSQQILKRKFGEV